MQIDDFIDEGGLGFQHNGDERGVSPCSFQIAQALSKVC
jgi:hypothetical protein